MPLTAEVNDLIDRAIQEDLSIGDATTDALIPDGHMFAPDLDPLLDPVFIGHQVRELLTHALVTVPAAWATGLWLARSEWGVSAGGTSNAAPLLGGLLGAGLGSYLVVAGLASGAAAQGQTESAILLVAPHFFEHGFSYAVVALLAGTLCETASHWDAFPERSGAVGSALPRSRDSQGSPE